MERKKFTDEEVRQRAIRRAAFVLFELWEEDRGAHSRLLEILVPDPYITIGTSSKGPGWKEHLVPLSFIRDECFKIFESGGGLDEATAFIGDHLKIAHISVEERNRLDFELGLKKRMPEAWEPGDYLARLNAAGIELK